MRFLLVSLSLAISLPIKEDTPKRQEFDELIAGLPKLKIPKVEEGSAQNEAEASPYAASDEDNRIIDSLIQATVRNELFGPEKAE